MQNYSQLIINQFVQKVLLKNVYHIIYLNRYLDPVLLANSQVSYQLVPEELKESENMIRQRKKVIKPMLLYFENLKLSDDQFKNHIINCRRIQAYIYLGTHSKYLKKCTEKHIYVCLLLIFLAKEIGGKMLQMMFSTELWQKKLYQRP